MNKFKKTYIITFLIGLSIVGCAPTIATKLENKTVPEAYVSNKDTLNSALVPWKMFFKDQNLVSLIDVALSRNQELQITLQEIEIAKNDIRMRKGALFYKRN